MSLDDIFIAIVLFSGFVVSGFGSVLLLSPFGRRFRHRALLVIACILPLVVAGMIVLFELLTNGQNYLVMAPFLLSFLVLGRSLLHPASDHVAAKSTKYNTIFLTLMSLSCGWAAWICWVSMDPCFMGACV